MNLVFPFLNAYEISPGLQGQQVHSLMVSTVLAKASVTRRSNE